MSAAPGVPNPRPNDPRAGGGGQPQPAQKPAAPAPKKPNPGPSAKERLVSLDAYRGFVMILMASEGLRLAETSHHFKDSKIWEVVGHQFEHVTWTGATFWDMIQPSFMFMVGVAMAYSCASRMARGSSYTRMLLHAVWRSFVLIALGVILRSQSADHLYWTFEDVLSQIGFGYLFLFLLWGHKQIIQWAVLATILVGYWALFYFWWLPPEDFNYRTVGVPGKGGPATALWEAPEPERFQYRPGPVGNWKHLEGTAQHWDKNTNAAQSFDRWFLNFLPMPALEIKFGRSSIIQAKPGRGPHGEFMYNAGGYLTLNFIPALATMILGLLAGELLRGSLSGWRKFGVLVGAGIVAIALGELLDRTGVCPVVKRIWTPSWTLWAGGVTLLMLAAFYAVVDLLKFRRWTFPLVVVGMNSIVMYCLFELCFPWIEERLNVTLGPLLNPIVGVLRYPFSDQGKQLFYDWRGPLFAIDHPSPYKPLVLSTLALGVTWTICYFLYRHKAFVKI